MKPGDAERLERLLRGHPEGLTRARLENHLGVDDRTARAMVEAVVAAGHLPVVTDRGDAATGRRYRLAGPMDHDAVNRQNAEDVKRALALLRKARGRRLAHERLYGASMFLDGVPAEIRADDPAGPVGG